MNIYTLYKTIEVDDFSDLTTIVPICEWNYTPSILEIEQVVDSDGVRLAEFEKERITKFINSEKYLTFRFHYDYTLVRKFTMFEENE